MVILKKWYSSSVRGMVVVDQITRDTETEVQLLYAGPKADSISFSQNQILLGRQVDK